MRRTSLREGTRVYLAGVHPQPQKAMQKSGFLGHLGADRVAPSVAEAVRLARAGAERLA